MINRYFFILLTLLSILFGEETAIIGGNGQIYFLSGELGVDGNNVIAYQDATVIYKDRYMRADTIVYNQKSRELEFFGNVSVVDKGLYFFVGDYAKVSLDGDATIRKMFLYHKPRHIWIYSDESNVTDDQFSLKDTFLSSCRSENPDWGFYVKEGYFDKKKHFFELYNVTLYATDIPIFYVPYLSFSTNKERKSGLLVPESGISSDEGFFYAQPIYYVPNYWSDLEVVPQVRTERGQGIYATYRFVDSPYSKGSFTTGYFNENTPYFNKWNLAHKKHYGFEFRYERSSLLRNFDDAFLVDMTYLNDIEYLSLKQHNSGDSETTNLIESKINYYMSYKNHHFGIYNRYVIDTDVEANDYSNDKTLQTLPHLQYHYGLDTLWSHILYSFDYNYKNFTRREGATATQHEVTIPVTLYWNFLDDYLKLRVTEHLYGSYINFRNTNLYQDDTNLYFRYYHQIELFTDISRRFKDNKFHSMDFGVNLLLPDMEKKKGFYTPVNSDNSNCQVGEPCEFQRVEKIDSTLELKFSQYLYDKSGDEVFYHKIVQPVVVEDRKIIKLDTLGNEFLWNITSNLSLYNGLEYAFDNGKVMKSSSTLKYNADSYSFDFSHFLKRDKQEEKLESISSQVSLNLNSRYRVFGHYSYDIFDKSVRSWGIGYEMKKRCWNYKLEYKQEYTPMSQANGTDSRRDNIIYFLVQLYPLGGFDYEYR